ncbi:MAG: ABC transporter ATP-binding protein [Gammaproteobacteria bacterium]|nr:ABC transporter ATP-binding protein [Gammaproteobacteria bacterium]
MKEAGALPFWGGGKASPKAAGGGEGDHRNFTAIVRIFARTWPYLLPHIVGYWRELPRGRDLGDGEAGDLAQTDAITDSSDDWSFGHVPPLVTALTAVGPLTGWLPFGTAWTHDLLLAATVLMTALTWTLLFVKGRAYLALSLALALVGTAAVLFAVLAVAGLADNLFVGLVAVGCVGIWVLQYRIDGGRLRLRIRLGSHLVYYFALVWVLTVLTMVIGLFSVDLISQSILQAEPLTPFLADFIGRPELSLGSAAATPGDGASANVDLELLTTEQRHSLKWVYAVFMVVSWLALVPSAMFLPYYYIFIMQRVNQDLRMALLGRWHRLSIRYHSDHRVGDSVYRIYQDSAQVTAVIGTITQAAQLLNTYVIGIVFLAALDPILGTMAASVVVLAVLWGRWYSPRMRERSLAAREANSDFTSRVQESFAAVRIVKAYGAGESEQERLVQDSLNAFDASYRVRTLMAIVGIVTFTLAAAALLGAQFLMAIWAQGTREVFAAVLVGLVGLSFVKWNLAAYNWAQDQLGASSESVRSLVTLWAQAQDMAMGLDRVFDILDIEPDVENDPDAIPMPPLKREIRFSHVGFAYEPGRPVLRDVSFAVQPGTVTAIVGPTGSGKSSLMSLLSRLFDPESGSISIDGTDLSKLDVDSLRRNVSVALQENVLFGMSVRDNIRYVVPDASDDEVRRAAHVACVDEYIAGLPEGLDTVLSDRGGKLSTGQRQRLSIARAVVKDAPILILDEPTAALDAHTEHRLLERLTGWGAGRAIFLITHRISTIRQADRVLYLDRGRIVENGSHDDLMRVEDGRYRNLVETEARLTRSNEADDSGSLLQPEGRE